MRRFFLVAAVAAIPFSLVVADSASAALSRAQCNRYIAIYGSTKIASHAITATRCLISRQRTSRGMRGYSDNATLRSSSGAHAAASVAAQSWSLTNGLVSHLNPGTPVPGDPNQLQQLANTQIDQRIRGAGYCAGGSAYSDGEITYGGSGTGQTPKAAVAWWMNDPPHRDAILSPQFTQYGVSVVRGSAFPGGGTDAATFVVDLGSCTP